MTMYNTDIVAAADDTIKRAIEATLALSAHEAVVMRSPAGGGKSFLITQMVAEALKHNMKCMVATPTNAQAYSLVGRLASACPNHNVTFVPSSAAKLPADIDAMHNVRQAPTAKAANGSEIMVGTLSKFGHANGRGDLEGSDLLLIDEAYQATATHYYSVSDLAPRHLLVGDSGQLEPFTIIDDAHRWRGLEENPLDTAVGVLRRYQEPRVFDLPISRRLDDRALPVVRAFYPDLAFGAAVQANARSCRLAAASSPHYLDAAIEHGSAAGWCHLELPEAPVLVADHEMIEVLVDLVSRLMARRPEMTCERSAGGVSSPLTQEQIAVGVSHTAQRELLSVALAEAGFGDVVVDTANRLQGLEFAVMVAWHPLSGLTDLDAFHLDAGRLCVLTTRHRHSCYVLGRTSDRALLEGPMPAAPAWIGDERDIILEGWEVHQKVFAGLSPHRVQVVR